MPKPTSRSMVFHLRPLPASDGPRPIDWAKVTQVHQGWFALAPQDGQAPQG
jgi:hypothetical protein